MSDLIRNHPEMLAIAGERPPASLTLRDMLGIGFRHKGLFALMFLVMLAAGICAPYILPMYASEMQIVIQRERMDPIISPDQNSFVVREAVTEEEINTEIELLRSADLLREVVVSAGLVDPGATDETTRNQEISKAARTLAHTLDIELIRKSNTIRVSYKAKEPEKAAGVLKKLGELYLKKHTAVHTPSNQVEFFQRQQEQYRTKLQQAEMDVSQFARDTGVLSATQEQALAVDRLANLKAQVQQTDAAIYASQARLAALIKLQASTPQRQLTAVRVADNPQLVQMKSTLMGLELKRTDLLDKYKPSYRAVQELDAQIAQARANIDAIERAPLRDETTDQNVSYEWIRSEITKAQAELTGLKAQADATRKEMQAFTQRATELTQLGVRQAELIRAAKSDEEDFLLYQRKSEEARISAALDKDRIVNVAIAEPPLVPALPKHSRLFYIAAALVAGFSLSSMAAYAADRFEPGFHSPRELELALQVPVLAALPEAELPRSSPRSNHTRNHLGAS